MASASDPTDTFPLFELPYVARKEFVQQAKLSDMITFSLISRECARLVKEAGFKIVSFEVIIDHREFRFTFWQFNSPRLRDYCIRTDVDPNRNELRPMRIILGSDAFDCVHFESSQTSIITIHTPGNKLRAFHSAVDHFQTVFGVQVYAIKLDANSFDHHEIWSSLPTCHNATLSGVIPEETITKFLENCTLSKSLQIDGVCETLVNHFDRICNLDELYIRSDATWFTLDHLRRIKCHDFAVETTSVTCDDLRQFITEWKEGTEQRFQTITLSVIDHPINRNLISAGPWRLQERHIMLNERHELQLTRTTDDSIMIITATDTTVNLHIFA